MGLKAGSLHHCSDFEGLTVEGGDLGRRTSPKKEKQETAERGSGRMAKMGKGKEMGGKRERGYR